MFLILIMGLVQAMEPDVNKLNDSTVLLTDSLEDFDGIATAELDLTNKIERSNQALKEYQEASKDLQLKMAKLKQLQEASHNQDELNNAMHESDMAQNSVKLKYAEYQKVRVPKIVSDDNDSVDIKPAFPPLNDNDFDKAFIELDEISDRYEQGLINKKTSPANSPHVTAPSTSIPEKTPVQSRGFKNFISNNTRMLCVTSLVLIGISAFAIYAKAESSQAPAKES